MPIWTCFNCMKLRDQDDVFSLDFSHHSLHDVPPDVFQYERTLEELYLNSNQISDLPRQLFYCQELKILHLNDNELSFIPPAISSLVNLQDIVLSRNALTTLPDTIKSCKHLVSLDLSVNSLERVPAPITSLISLQELYLNDTFLEFLPANFGRLINLRILELRDNNLITLPKSIARLTNLTRIDIGHNEFTELPEVVGQLVNLTELWIDSNRIRRISSSVGNLRKLVHFEASNNLLTHLPNEVGNWAKLQDLSISANELEHLPFSIGMMKCLITIKVDENQLQELPESICQLDSLEELMISHNDLFRLPPSIGLLRKLRYLTADENLLRHLPNELCSCIALTILSARGNKLTDIPPDIGHLINLRVINIVNNFITHLPVSLLGLTQLSALWISDNQSLPLMPLQKEYGPEQSVHLTCFMLPQVLSTSYQAKERDSSTAATTPKNSNSADSAVIAKRRICFASDPVASVEQTGRLMRSPTPYPKELRVLAKYAKNMQKSATGDYVHVEDIQEPKYPETANDDNKEVKKTNSSTLQSASRSTNGSTCYTTDEQLIEQQSLIYHENPPQISVSSQRQLQNYHQSQDHHLIPLLGSTDETNATRSSYFYATVDKKSRQITDYENHSTCSSSVANDYVAHKNPESDEPIRINKYGVEYNPIKDTTPAGIRMSQASSYGGDSNNTYSEQFSVHDDTQQYYTNQPLLNQCYPYIDSIHNGSSAAGSSDVHSVQEFTNGYNTDAIYYQQPAAIGCIYSNDQSTWINQATNRSSMGSDSIYTTSSTLNETVPRQPPPYHIAKAFTKKSKQDLLIYNNYRNKNTPPIGEISGNGNDIGFNKNRFYNLDTTSICSGSEIGSCSDRPISSVSRDLAVNKDNYENEQKGQNEHSRLDLNLNSTQQILDEQNMGIQCVLSNTPSKSSLTHSGKAPWIFGLHKNPTVLQLNVPKTPDIGFKISEQPNHVNLDSL